MSEQQKRESEFPAEPESGVQVRPTVVHLPAAYPEGFERPRTYDECEPSWKDGSNGGCPLVGCRHNLFLDVAGTSIRFAYRRTECPTDIKHSTCAAWLADRGGMTLEEVGEVLGVTRERIRQIETRALRRYHAALDRDNRTKRREAKAEPVAEVAPELPPVPEESYRARCARLPEAIQNFVLARPGAYTSEILLCLQHLAKRNSVYRALGDLRAKGELRSEGRRWWSIK